MKLYTNIFASAYNFYSGFATEAPLFSAVLVVTVCQIEMLFLMIVLLKVYTGTNLFSFLPNKFYFLPILGLWIFFIYKYYSKDRVDAIINKYDKKASGEKRFWGITTITLFILPIVLIAFLLTK